MDEKERITSQESQANGDTQTPQELKNAKKQKKQKEPIRPITPEEKAEFREKRRQYKNSRIARGRFFKNLIIWLLGVLFLPTVIVVSMAFIPVKTFTGRNNDVLSEELANKSLLSVAMTVATNFSSFGFSDFPIVKKMLNDLQTIEIMDGKRLGDIVNIDTEKLNAIKFGGSDFTAELQSCVDVVATLDSLGAVEMLGDFGRISVINEYSSAGTIADVTTGSGADRTVTEGKNAKEYYYKISADEYERAFTDDGKIVAALSSAAADTELFYPALKDVKLVDLVDIVDESFGRVTVSSLLDVFGASNETLIDILGEDTTISGIKDFDMNSVKLSSVIEINSSTQKLYDVIVGATPATSAEEVSIGHLSDFDIDGVLLNSVIEISAETQTLYDILVGATPASSAETVTIADLSDIDITAVELKTIIDESGNEDLYRIIRKATGVGDSDEVTVEDLENFDVNGIPLTAVLNESGNTVIYDVLRQATGAIDNAAITIGMLSTSFDVNNIALSSVLAIEGNETIYNILKDATGAASNSAITIGMLSTSFDVTDVSLVSVLLPDSSNADLYTILREATGKSTNAEIKIGSLSSFDASLVSLVSVLSPDSSNAKLYTILREATGKSTDAEIKIGSLSSFDIGDVSVDTVIDPSYAGGNKVLNAILGKGYTLSQLGTAIDDMDVSEIFDVECFTTTAADAIDTTVKYSYNPATKTYTRDDVGGTYYISKNAKIWLFVLYDYAGVDSHDGAMGTKTGSGVAASYTAKVTTFGNITDTLGSVSQDIMDATIRQLILTNVIDAGGSDYSSLYPYSLNDILEKMADIL